MTYTNSQILSAVLSRWLRPMVQQLAGQRLASIPLLSGIENKIRSTGWVRPSWSMAGELAPLMQNVTDVLLEPLLRGWLAKVPDEALPQLAHSLTDQAIANGGWSLFDGNVTFDKSDLQELKELLEYNLPLGASTRYEVKTAPGGAVQ